jgi:GDPmannose 4,6-dehydratase
MPSLPPRLQRRAFITGITGQDGSYLAELLVQKGYEVWGMVRRASLSNTQRLGPLDYARTSQDTRLHLAHGDLTDTSSIRRILDSVRPDEVYNLGAQSHVHVSFEMPEYTGDVSGLGTVRLLEAIHQLGLKSRFYQASTSELFGKVRETPQRETTPFHPRSPYGAAKAYAFEIVRVYRESYGMFAANGILFNHESPRRGETFVTRKITRAAAAIVQGRQKQLKLGNLDAQRDWGFAGDFVEAMWLMLQADEPQDYVIATGETHTVREFCERAFHRAGLPLTWRGLGVDETGVASDGRTVVAIDPQYFRPAEVDLLIGDASKAERELGWKPKVSFTTLVEMMVDHDLAAGQKGCPS